MLIDKIIEFYVLIDDFNIEFEVEIKKHLLESNIGGKRRRASQLSEAEIMSILLLFHYGSCTPNALSKTQGTWEGNRDQFY